LVSEPLVIFNDCKGFFIFTLGRIGPIRVTFGCSRAQSRAQKEWLMNEPSRDDVLEAMREAFRTRLHQYRDFNYGVLQTETAQMLLTQKPAVNLSGKAANQAAQNYFLNEPLAVAFGEAFWYLVSTGFVIPTPSGNAAGNFNFVKITKLGKEWAAGT